MKTYLQDPDQGPRRRNWNVMLPDHVEVRWDPLSQKFISSSEEVQNGVLVWHYQDMLGPSAPEFSAAHVQNLVVILVSGSDRPRISNGSPVSPNPCPHVYWRRRRVGNNDPVFARCFRRFVDEIVKSPEATGNWALLEPDHWANNLLAVYLLLAAVNEAGESEQAIVHSWNSMPQDSRKSVLTAAWREYQDLGGNPNRWVECGLALDAESGSAKLPAAPLVARAMEVISFYLKDPVTVLADGVERPRNHVADTIECVLKGKYGRERIAYHQPNPAADFLVASYLDDFASLWKLASQGQLLSWLRSRPGQNSTIVLVWDGTPEPKNTTINIRDYVTPFDWAVAISLSVHSILENDAKALAFRILILDIDSHDSGDAFGPRAFAAMGATLPWVQVYRPVEADYLPLAVLPENRSEDFARLRVSIPPRTFGLPGLLRDCFAPDRIMSFRVAQEELDYSTLIHTVARFWTSHLLGPIDRHHVGNLLSPLLLFEALPETLKLKGRPGNYEGDPLPEALACLISALGVATPAEKTSTGKSPLPIGGVLFSAATSGDIFGRRKKAKILLVDDQYHTGYHNVLAYSLFGNRYKESEARRDGQAWTYKCPDDEYELRCESNPDRLLKALLDAPSQDDWARPRFLDIGYDLLFLDLRLWTGGIERRRLLNRVLLACDHLNASAIKDRAFARAYQSAQSLVRGESVSEIEALTLLPLLLSHYDPSLPIVLFSSTHQWSVLEMTGSRSNIIADFTKPIIDGYGKGRTSVECLRDLIKAIHRGVDLHEQRLLWQELVSVAPGNTRRVDQVRVGPRKHQPVFKDCPITSEQIQGLASEYINTIGAGRFSDSLLVAQQWLENLSPPAEKAGTEVVPQAAQLVSWIIRELRHARAHRGIAGSDSSEVRDIALWLFLWLLRGQIACPRNIEFVTVRPEQRICPCCRIRFRAAKAWYVLCEYCQIGKGEERGRSCALSLIRTLLSSTFIWTDPLLRHAAEIMLQEP